MDELHPRHRYGTYVLILALLALAFAGFSKGAVWATVDDESTTIDQDATFGNLIVNVSMTSDLHLREMETEMVAAWEFDVGGGNPGLEEAVEFSVMETYDELAQNSAGNVSSTFEDLDNAGVVAGWMIWIGIVSVIITAILSFCSLAQLVSARPAMLTGGISTFFLFLTPIIWYFNLPSDSTYASAGTSAALEWPWFEGEIFVNFEPMPSTGVFLSILGGLCSVAMMWMIVLYNRAELTEEKPSWMIADDSTILPNATLPGLFSSDGESITLNFSTLKSQPKKLLMPAIQVLLIILFSSILSGTWASYTIGFDELELGLGLGNEDISFTEEEIIIGQGDDSIKTSYMGMDESLEEMGEVIGQSVTIGSIAIWMLILSLVWRFAVSTGGAQKIPALCQHHRIIDTSLMTGGLLLAFISLLYFTIKSPSSAELFTDIPDEIIAGGTSFLILFLMVLLVPFSIGVFTFGEHGAPVRKFLRSFDIPIPGEEEDVATASLSSERLEGVGTLLQNPFDNPRISGLPWVTIGVVILVLFALGGGGYLAYKIVGSSDDSDDSQTMMLYDLSYDAWSPGQAFDSVNVGGGQVVTWTFDQESAPDDSSLYAIFITFDYDETDPDLFCDELDVVLSGTPTMFDNQNSTGSGSADDCGQVVLSLYVERGLEGSQLDGSQVLLNSDEVDSTRAYFNEHDGGMGTWEFSIGVEDVGAGFENGEEVTMTIEPMFATMGITEVV